MPEYVGLDWAGKECSGAVLREDGTYDFDLYPSILSVWNAHRDADRILVDLPIGLRRDGKRACDEAAATVLKPHRHDSVFATPVREAVYAETLSKAKKYNEEHGFSVTNQAWAICPHIREVDELFDLFPGAIGTVREAHPEVCFAALGGGPLEHPMGTDEGLEPGENSCPTSTGRSQRSTRTSSRPSSTGSRGRGGRARTRPTTSSTRSWSPTPRDWTSRNWGRSPETRTRPTIRPRENRSRWRSSTRRPSGPARRVERIYYDLVRTRKRRADATERG
jgi:hypothetical protein